MDGDGVANGGTTDETLSTSTALETEVQDARAERDTPCEFLCGVAGSGKTFSILERISTDPEWGLLTASTGIAAVNLGSVTVHSALGYFDTASLRDAYLTGQLVRRLHQIALEYHRLVIDEVSMVDGDQLSLIVRAACEANQYADLSAPLGLVLVGDFAQLPPIRAPWAFESDEWHRFAAHTTKLTKVWRQAQPHFLAALNLARSGDGLGSADLLSAHGLEWRTALDTAFDGTTIVSKNDQVDRYNWMALERVPGPKFTLPSRRWGRQRSEWKQVPDRLELKDGAYVMLLSNYYSESRDLVYANGDCGHVRGREGDSLLVELVRNGAVVSVPRLVRDTSKREKPPGWRDSGGAVGHGEYLPRPHWLPPRKRFVEGQLEYYPVRLAYASTVHKCVASWERIPVIGRGWIEVSNCRPDDMTPYGPIKALAITNQPAIKLTTGRGYEVVCSAEHRWMTSKGLCAMNQMSVGDRIELAQFASFSGTNELTQEFAWWLGAVVGDGCYTDIDDGTIHFACKESLSLGERYKKFVEGRGLRCSWRSDRKGLHHTSRSFRNQLLAMGLDYVKGPVKKIPYIVWESGPDSWGNFLQGMFDTDGSVGRSFVVFTTSSERMSKDVQLMLLGLGITSKRRGFRTGYRGGHSLYWQVFIPSFSLDRFRTRVGFYHPQKAAKLAATKPNRSLVRFDGYDNVTGISFMGDSIPMYDVEIAAPHLLSFGPFVGHNCQGLSLDRAQIDIRNPFFSAAGMEYVSLSRCRTLEGLRIVGQRERFVSNCKTDAKIREWL